MGRKTFKIVDFQNRINEQLKLDTITQAEKSVLCITLESMLMETDNYAGFAFDSSKESDTFVAYDKATDTYIYGPKRYNRFYFIHRNLQ